VIRSPTKSHDTRQDIYVKKACDAFDTAFDIYDKGWKSEPSLQAEEEINQYLSLSGLYFELVEVYELPTKDATKQIFQLDSDSLKMSDLAKQKEQYILSLKEQVLKTSISIPKRNHKETKTDFLLSREIQFLFT
jgi:hypothetical protein